MKRGMDYKGVEDSYSRHIKNQIYKAIDTALGTKMEAGEPDAVRGNKIRIEISQPRPYMGRFDDGKRNWTIDFKEIATYSRTKQVRVKVIENDKNKPQLDTIQVDAEKLREVMAELQAIVERDADHGNKLRAAHDKVPNNTPSGLYVNAQANENATWYEVVFRARVDEARMREFIKLIHDFQSKNKKDKVLT